MTKLSDKHAEANDLVAELGVAEAGGRLGVAAVLYTYQCTIACRHCCFGCGASPADNRMTTDQAVARLAALHELGRVIHIAGGECMMYWDDLREVLAAAHAVSADPFHQAFVPPDRFCRVRRLARELFGARNVWCTNEPDERIGEFAAIARDERRLREYVRAAPPMLVGTAHAELRAYLEPHPLGELPLDGGWRLRYRTRDCAIDFRKETIWEIHVDPYDNIQTNCGVILGDASRTSLAELMQRGPDKANFIVEILVRDGPFGLAEFAANQHGFVPPETAASKCDLCFTVRMFLRPFYPDILGPAEVYGN